MMRLVWLAVLLLAIPAAAQDDELPTLTEVYTSPRGSVQFRYPEGWHVRFSYLNEGWFFNATLANYTDGEKWPLGPDDVGIGIALTRADSRFGYSRPEHRTPRDVIATGLRYPDYADAIPDDIREYEIGGRAAASAWYEGLMGFQTYAVAVEAWPGEALIWSLGVSSQPDQFDIRDWAPLVDQVAETLVYTPAEALPLAELVLPSLEAPLPTLEPIQRAAVTVSAPVDWVVSAYDNERDDIVAFTAVLANESGGINRFMGPEADAEVDDLLIIVSAEEAWARETIGLDAFTSLERDTFNESLPGRFGPMLRTPVGDYEAAVIDLTDVAAPETARAFEMRRYWWVVPRGAEPRETVHVRLLVLSAPGGIAANARLIDAIAQSMVIDGALKAAP